MSNVYPSNHPLVAHKLSILRDVKTDPQKFRELVKELATLLTYEATANLARQADSKSKLHLPWPTPLKSPSGSVLYRFYGPGWEWWKVSGSSSPPQKFGILAYIGTRKLFVRYSITINCHWSLPSQFA